jgi:cytidine deaminase
VTASSNRYSGVCIDTGSGTGFCADTPGSRANISTEVVTGRDTTLTLRELLPPNELPPPLDPPTG